MLSKVLARFDSVDAIVSKYNAVVARLDRHAEVLNERANATTEKLEALEAVLDEQVGEYNRARRVANRFKKLLS